MSACASPPAEPAGAPWATVPTGPPTLAPGQRCTYIALPRRPGEKTKLDEENDDQLAIRVIKPIRSGAFKFGVARINAFCLCFNKLWCLALNDRESEGLTHFAMQHSDIVPAPYWVDTLIDEMERTGSDVMSAVVPIKTDHGLTSTAVRNWATGETRRLTMTEVMRLPETFGIGDVKAAGITPAGDGPKSAEILAVNTGLWVCRLDAPWIEQFKGWTYSDAVTRLPDGQWAAGMVSEDWVWSEWLQRRGCKVMATRKVPLAHVNLYDGTEYRNDSAWGTMLTDTGN